MQYVFDEITYISVEWAAPMKWYGKISRALMN